MFELYYLPIHLLLGEEQPDLPGLVVKTAPRRAQRSRSQDVLIAFLTPFGGAHPGARTLESMLEETAALYYKSRGSATSGLREAADHLNHLFLKYNAGLHGNRKDGQIFAYLNLAVLRDDLLFMAHVGSTAAYLLQPDRMQQFRSDANRGRGLGISRTAPLALFQAKLDPDTLLLLCPDPPAGWSEAALAHGSRLTINLLRRRIASTATGELRAGIIQFRSAEVTAVHRLRPKSPFSPGDEPPDALQTPRQIRPQEHLRSLEAASDAAAAHQNAADEEEFIPMAPEQMQVSPVEQENEQLEDLEGEEPYEDVVSGWHDETPQGAQPAPGATRTQPAAPPPQRQKPPPRQADPMRAYKRAARRQAARKKVAGWWQAWNANRERIGRGVKSAFARLLPGMAEDSPQISAGWLLFISLAVPLLVVTMAVTVYLRNGRDQQHQLYLQQAQAYASEARQAEEPAAERSNWNQAFHWLDLAEEYRVSEESELLRRQASAALDLLDGVERLEFNTLLPFGFASTLNFTQIAANDTEVYLLDSSQGRVLRLFLTGQGYELDNEFACAPGASGTRLIGDLVDLIMLPPGSPSNATVMAIDGRGALLYCIPGAEAPLSGELITPLDGWGELKAIAYYQGALYVLDSLYGAVYTYRGYNMKFDNEPVPFFDRDRGDTIPDLREMIDLAAYAEDLYLLKSNGAIARCTSGIFEDLQSRCEDPAAFGDMRPGMDDRTLIFPNAYFTQIQASLPPDPSLFLMDVNAPAIYRFSLQLNLDRLFQPSLYGDIQLPQPPSTAFTLSPSRVLFLAYGNEVIYASLNR